MMAYRDQLQSSVPDDWYSVTRVSKKFFSLLRSIVSLIQGNGFDERYWVGSPTRSSRRSAMNCT